MRVLVVEDELRMASLIRRGLVKEGLAADIAPNGEEALVSARASDYDAIVLDVMLPGINGFETCRRLREGGVWAPVLMLTARDSVEDRVAGLDTGADDYLVKPFAFAELLARLRALARRGDPERPPVLALGDLRPAFAEGVFAPRDVHAPAWTSPFPSTPARARLGLRLREPLERRRCVHPPPAPQDRRAVRAPHS